MSSNSLSLAFAALALSPLAVAQQITYVNGPLSSAQTGGGAAGTSSVSVVQTTGPVQHSLFGYSASSPSGFALADDFVVTSTLRIDAIEVFGYTPNAIVPSCTGVYVSIWDADPSFGTANQLLPGAGPTTNLIGQAVNTFADVYRVSSVLTATSRQVQSVLVNLPTAVDLTAGTYWLEWSFDGISFVAPLATTNVAVTGNAMQRQGSTYSPIVNGPNQNPQGLPFQFHGLWPTGDAGSIRSLGGGCSTATMTVQGSPVLGGYVRSEITDVNPATFPLTVLGLQEFDLPMPGCLCRFRSTVDVIAFGPSYEVQIPPDPTLLFAKIYFQGAQLAFGPGITACSSGLDFDLTDAFEYAVSTPWTVADLVMFDETEDYTQLMAPSPGVPIDITIIDLGPFDLPHQVTWSSSSPDLSFVQDQMVVTLGQATRRTLQLLVGNVTGPELVTITGTISGPGGSGVVTRDVVVRPSLPPACRVLRVREGVTRVLPDSEVTHKDAHGKFWSQHVAKTPAGEISVLMIYGGFGRHGSMQTFYRCTTTGCVGQPSCNGAATDVPEVGGAPRTVRIVCDCQPSS